MQKNMECPHLKENVRLEKAPAVTETDVAKEWHCTACQSAQSTWLCLHCGIVGCGRYVNGHAKQHALDNQNHSVCMDSESYAVYCYICDEFALNDTPENHIERMRNILMRHPTKGDEVLLDDGSINDENGDVSSISNDKDAGCANGDIDKHSDKQSDRHSRLSHISEQDRKDEPGVRQLRPRRKRSHSADSSSLENHGNNGKRRRNGMVTRTLSKAKPEKKVVGLRNLGNTCFMNAVLQSLSNIGVFYRYFKHLPALETNSKSGRGIEPARKVTEVSDALMTEELRKVLINLNQGGKTAISPESLFHVIWKIVPRFRGYQQQDAHEFLRYMLDRLHLELLHLLPDGSLRENSYLNIGPKSRSSIVTSVFGGTLQSEVRCLNCCVESKKHDPFLDLSLDIPEKFQYQKKAAKDSTEEPTTPCDISDCLTSFVEVEELAETELYYCNNCKSKQRSTKRFWIRRLPNVLCLHLKRFRWHNCLRQKIDTSIMFPVTALDMSQYVLSSPHETRRSGAGSTLYDLAAVIVHHGSGTGSGHYTAFAVNDGGQWFHFNDSSVRQTEIETVANCKPYIMFYIRREFRLPQLQA